MDMIAQVGGKINHWMSLNGANFEDIPYLLIEYVFFLTTLLSWDMEHGFVAFAAVHVP